MKTTNNDKGYALLIVLLLIVLIMSISAVFMRGAISNAKQEQRVDKNHLSIVSAEMGVDYYATAFTNRYYEVKDLYWNDAVQRYKSEIEKPGFKGDAKKLAAEFDLELKNKIVTALQGVNAQELPKEALFQMGPKAFVVKASDNLLLINGEVSGEYLDGKASILELDMKFNLPSVLADTGDGGVPPVKEPGDEPGSGSIGGFPEFPDYNYINVQIPVVESIPMISVQNEKSGKGDYFNKGKVDIQKKGDIDVGVIQQNSGSVTLLAEGKIKTKNVYQNKKVEIRGNDNYQSEQISKNTGLLTIVTKGDYQGFSNFDENENVVLKTNGKFQLGPNSGKTTDLGQLDNNGYLNIESTQGFYSNTISKNKETNIITNGDFTTGLILGKGKNEAMSLNVSASKNVTMGLIKNNNNVDIKTGDDGEFQAYSIQDNNNVKIQTKGGIQIDDDGDDESNKSKTDNKVKSNTNIDLYSGGEVQIDDDLYENKNVKIYSVDDFESGLVQNNTDLLIHSGDEVEIEGNLYGNTRATIFSNGKYQSGLVQENKSLVIKSKNEIQIDNGLNQNNTLDIFSKKKFSVAEIKNNTGLVILSKGEVDNSGEIYGNSKSKIYSKGKFAATDIKQNPNSIFYSMGEFQAKEINQNNNITIVSLGKFQADKVVLNSTSKICAAKEFDVNLDKIQVDKSSAIYVRDSSKANDVKRIFYIDEEEWKDKCSVDFDFPTDEEDKDKDKPVFVDPGNGGWKRPSIDVKYNSMND